MKPNDHVNDINRAIEYCKERKADRFGGFILRTLQKCLHSDGCGVFDEYDCDCTQSQKPE